MNQYDVEEDNGSILQELLVAQAASLFLALRGRTARRWGGVHPTDDSDAAPLKLLLTRKPRSHLGATEPVPAFPHVFAVL